MIIRTDRPVIAIAGLGCETSSFSPARTDAKAFHPLRGDEIINRYSFLQGDLGKDAIWKGALVGKALPGGVVLLDAFESLTMEILNRLGDIILQGPLDGIWFDIHGALVAESYRDAEAHLLQRIRAVVGPNVMISTSMDLHGNVSSDLAWQSDLITCYREAPHIDEQDTKERACRNLVNLLKRSPARRPLKAWIPIPVLLPGEQTSTRIEPAKSIYAKVPQVESSAGVIDASIWVGYCWADEQRNRAAVVVTGWEEDAVSQGAEKLAKSFWEARKEFKFVAPTGNLGQCLDAAIASPKEKRPYFISDSGDNPTAGGAGDVTWSLQRILDRSEFKESGPVVIYASLPGPKAVETAVAAGLGATITVTAGAEVDKVHAPPLTMTGRVHAIKHGDRDAEVEVVLQVGSVFVILTRLRKPYHKEKDFLDLKLKPREADVVIVKIGYLEPELYDMARGWMLALTPGGVDQDLERLGHQRIRRPCWPFDKDFDNPDLTTRWIPKSNEPLRRIKQ
ncbi:hypothetical protein HIM_01158 [Hirsutella minnesotensis 3608]|nr:hypothetical protein HIM_01158 [Hirsutella minnesotensis 3608]